MDVAIKKFGAYYLKEKDKYYQKYENRGVKIVPATSLPLDKDGKRYEPEGMISVGHVHNQALKGSEPQRLSNPGRWSEPAVRRNPVIASEPEEKRNPLEESEPHSRSNPGRWSEPTDKSNPMIGSEPLTKSNTTS